MFFWSITFKMQISCHQRFNWNLQYLNTFNDTHERARHVIQHIELFANKFNLILMDPWGGHSLYILPSTSNRIIIFYMVWNNWKILIYFKNKLQTPILHKLSKLYIFKTPISWTLFFLGFCLEWNGSNLPSIDQFGRQDNPPKSAFKHAFIIIIIWMLKVWRNTELWFQGPGFIFT